jgi:hypothetical protein
MKTANQKPKIYLSITKTGVYVDFVDIKPTNKIENQKKLLSTILTYYKVVE